MTFRIAICSDLHGQSAATEATLAAINSEGADAVLSKRGIDTHQYHP